MTRAVALAVAALTLLTLHGSQVGATPFKRPAERLLYVAENGTQTAPCTKARPCQTILEAVQRARAGDVVLVASGSYAAFDVTVPAKKLVTIWGVPGAGSPAVVEGDVNVNRGRIILANLQIEGVVSMLPEASGSALLASAARGFNIFGAHDILIKRNRFDGRGEVAQNFIWDQPAGQQPTNWRIVGNTFSNFYDADDPSVHSEALFVGFSERGLIEGNTFTNNGNTAHLFFSWFGSKADPATTFPREICVKRNLFGRTHQAYTAIAFRDEIPVRARIRIDPSNRGGSTTAPAFNGRC